MARRRLDASEYTVGWICALPVELAAAQVMLDEEHERHNGLKSTQYTLGRMGSHNVVLACLPAGHMGIGPAAFAAGQITSNFTSIRFGLIVGIAGGVPSPEADVRLGDVVVSQPVREHGGVVQYDFGKTGRGGHMTRTGSLNAPPAVLLHAVAQLRAYCYQERHDKGSLESNMSGFKRHPNFSRDQAGPDVLYEATYHHAGGGTCEECSEDHIVTRTTRPGGKEVTVHYGTIASGSQVIKDGSTRDRLSKELGGVLCFEMEAAGLMNDFPCLAVRGICDYADSHKNKTWQPYAAATAAACAKLILSLIPREEVVKTATSNEASKYRIPFSLKGVPVVGKFAERPVDTQALEHALLQRDSPKERRLMVVHGLGGMGKTQLAANFGQRHQKSFSSVLWLDGSGESRLKQSFAAFASRIPQGQIPEASRSHAVSKGGDVDAVVRDVLVWLSIPENDNWLMVIDNVDRDDRPPITDEEAYDVEEYLPEADHGSVLITTRLMHLGQLADQRELKKVDQELSLAIFTTLYKKDVDLKTCHEANELMELLDGLPLALAQAAAYMTETGTSFSTYTRLYKEKWPALMDTSDRRRRPLRNYANGSVVTTWTISYTAIQDTNEAAANLLLLWAHLDNKILWHGLLTPLQKSAAAAKQSHVWLTEIAFDELKFVEAVGTLRSYSLIEEAEDQSCYSMHPVVHQWALHMQDYTQRTALSRLSILLVAAALTCLGVGDDHWETRLRLFAHTERCYKKVVKDYAANESEEEEKHLEKALPAAICGIASFYYNQSNFRKAEEMYMQALKGYEKLQDVSDIFSLFTQLGSVFFIRRNFDQATTMYKRVLEAEVEAVGETWRLRALDGLGNVYNSQGDFDKAEKIYLQVIQNGSLPTVEVHKSVFRSLQNLGTLYKNKGHLDKAEDMYLEALTRTTKELGKDYPSTLHTRSCLGRLYQEQGRSRDAEDMYLQAIDDQKRILGKDHPLTLSTIDSLAELRHEQGRFAEAEELYEQVLESKRRWLGDDESSTISTAIKLAELYKEQGRLAQAETMYLQVLERRRRVLGDDNLSTIITAGDLADLYKEQGKLDRAEAMYLQVLESKRRVLGDDQIYCTRNLDPG